MTSPTSPLAADRLSAPDPGRAGRYAVVGNPVAHSRSPSIHAAFAAATGEAVAYGRVLAPLDGFQQALRDFAAQGGLGCNVTVPFKLEAFELCPRHSERALLAQAANTLRFDEQGWWADNTDGVGLVRDIEQNAGVALAGQRLLLVGAGGGAAGALGPLLAARPAELVLVNRTVARAQALVDRHAPWADQHGARLRAAALDQAGEAYDVVINASATSLGGVAVPVAPQVLRPGSLALDMMYGPSAQRFMAWATGHGATGRDGLGMLVEQAAEAFFVWRGVRPATAPVFELLRGQVAADAARAPG